MKMIHVIPAVAAESSGPTYSVTRLCESLRAQGAEVTLAALDLAPPARPRAYLRTFALGWGPRALGSSPAMHRWLRERVASGGVDVVHNHGMWQFNALYPGWSTRRGRARLVVSPRGAFSAWAMRSGSAAKRLFWPLLQRPALSGAACFHATCDAEYRDIRRLGFTQPVAIVPNGVDLPDLDVAGASDGATTGAAPSSLRTLLFLGRLHPVKGLDLLLEAWATLEPAFADWRLLIVGDDGQGTPGQGYRATLEASAARLGLSRVTFAGELLGDAKRAAMHGADLFVLPSRSENFAIAVAEALAAGVPAVVTQGAPWSGLADNDAGWWVETRADALRDALAGAMRLDAPTLRAMGARGREWMRRDFAWDAIAQRMLAVYGWLDGTTTRPPDCVRLD